jgi:hypothetical protein
LSIKHHPNRFKLDFGSTVTILTTGVADIKHCRRVSGQGIFTGVVIDESELKLKRSPKHVLISVEGLSEFQSDIETESTDPCWQNDYEVHQPHDEDHVEHKEKREVKKAQEFVILSLTCPSFPFAREQIVWISLDQIIALSVLCRPD